MQFNDVIELGHIATDQSIEGFAVNARFVPEQEVCAEAQSVSRSEFYQAEAAGINLTASFAVWADEYNKETAVRWQGTTYTVKRAYQKKNYWLLNCSTASAVQEKSNEISG